MTYDIFTRITEAILFTFAAVTIVWDVIALKKAGAQATFSVVLYEAAKKRPIICVLIGVLIGHAFWPLS